MMNEPKRSPSDNIQIDHSMTLDQSLFLDHLKRDLLDDDRKWRVLVQPNRLMIHCYGLNTKGERWINVTFKVAGIPFFNRGPRIRIEERGLHERAVTLHSNNYGEAAKWVKGLFDLTIQLPSESIIKE